jgi:hypothetical protein
MDKSSWEAIKTSFLGSFKHKYSGKMVCANLQDLMQKPGEAELPYFTQNVETFKCFLASKSNELPQATQAEKA